MSNKVNSSSIKSNKSFIGTYRGIVTRCPSHEPDPDGENKIQICIPSFHGAMNDNKVGSGNNPGQYPWARICFSTTPITSNSSSSSSEDLTESGSSSDDSDTDDKSKSFSIDKCLFISDNIFSKMKNYLKDNKDEWIYKDSADINWLKSSMSKIEKSIKGDITVVICLGLFDCGTNDYKDKASKYVKYIDNKAKQWKNKKIYTLVVSIGPVNSTATNYGSYNLYINKFNEYLNDNLKTAKFLSLSSIDYKFDKNSPYYYNKDTYINIYNTIKKYEIPINTNNGKSNSTNNTKNKVRAIARTKDKEDKNNDDSSKDFKPRLVKGDIETNKYWTTSNPFYPSYGLPNCTCYAWGRAYEILGHKPKLPLSDAGAWVSNLNGAYPVSKDQPQLGDICCWSGGSDGGHVAVVEKVSADGNTITTSNSAYGGNIFYTSTHTKANKWCDGVFSKTSATLNGFIHIGKYKSSSSSVSVDSESSSSSSGSSTVSPYPIKGDTVWVTFEGGDIRYPLITGLMKPKIIAGSGSDSSDDSMLEGGTLAKLAADIIIYEEVGDSRVYDSVIGNDNGALSIGLLGFHEDRARDVIRNIYKEDKSAVPPDLANKLHNSWGKWKVPENGSDYNNLKQALKTSTSKQVQDKMVIDAVQGYIDAAKKMGIKDNAALIYAADLHNQGGLGALQACYAASTKPITLQSLHNGAMSTYMSGYPTRRNRVYNKIKKLKDSGKLTESSLSASGQAGKVVEIAKKEIGYKASDHGGATKYGKWWGQYVNGGNCSYNPWCMYFVQWCLYRAGVKKSSVVLVGNTSDSIGSWKSKGLWHDRSGYTPKSGDLIMFNQHVGIVSQYKNNKVYTIEGNTGASPGCVGTHEYDVNGHYSQDILGYITPKYSS